MADRRRSRTETVSLRLDPKIKFMIDFMAHLQKRSITSVVEISILEAANRSKIESYDSYGNHLCDKTWQDFWDVSEGVRTLKLLSDQNYPTSAEEDEIREFTLAHWQFFYASPGGEAPRRGYVDVLWPDIDTYLETWKKKKSQDYWAVGNLMRKKLLEAQLVPPRDWPPTEKDTSKPSKADDIDDDIPF